MDAVAEVVAIGELKAVRQRAFDAMLAHLRQQGRRAMSADDSSCMYRGTGDSKCGVGGLIDDEHYNPNFEMCAADSSEIVAAVRRSGYPLIDAEFLLEAQDRLHDGVPDKNYPAELEEAAEDFAVSYGLVVFTAPVVAS